jgi:hypothetical protein
MTALLLKHKTGTGMPCHRESPRRSARAFVCVTKVGEKKDSRVAFTDSDTDLKRTRPIFIRGGEYDSRGLLAN